ncbi:helix-hairpin-helix domain-containing protein [uncultured Clostridium sp.]|uniref:helix-hairpin-helix domain-containing protein n=1 Tax=uncultured Clostridium sp. TaxID=59620 RepID=UPI002600FA17|nr:helix-hairpin-helix domain-containing protein [uncultured Clostridium sp.]MED9924667.1 helix-hairpin-helix domain-containing protein [Clostridia bacterium]
MLNYSEEGEIHIRINDFNKKNKILLIVIVAIVAIISYYFIFDRKEEWLNNQEQNLEIKEEIKTNDQIENNSNEQQLEKNENIIVHVSGAVNKEGIVELKNNSRIIDAIDKAGGLKDEADITNINLAYIIEDGMKIHIPSKEEKESTIIVESNIDSGTVEQSNEIKSNNNKKLKININTATKTDLETLPGIGESTALKIIEYRKKKGKFKLIEDIKQVNGIGENKFNKIKELITV